MNDFLLFLMVFEAGVKVASRPVAPCVLFASAQKSGWSDDPRDAGGATMCGVTLSTYAAWCRSMGYPTPTKKSLRNIPFEHWRAVVKSLFWDKARADEIKCPALAWIIVDWVWASGPKVIRNVQRIVGVKADGIFGPKSLAALNAADGARTFDAIMVARREYIDACCRARPVNEAFRRGWLNRLDAICFESLILKNPPK